MSIPLVSIIIPVYNRLVYLGETIESVLSQTCTSWELIVVDDGSQEDVAGFVMRCHDARIRFIRQENLGNASARNTGITQSRGEYIICLDSDDIWHPAMLDTCVALFDTHPEAHVVYTQVQSVDGDGHFLPGPIRPTPYSGDLLEPLLLGHPILPSSALARRSCFECWGNYAPGLDDWELWLRWSSNGCHFVCIEQPLLYYRIHAQNFNLAYDQRRAAHFAMLDKFYSQENLLEKAQQLRDRAYGRQHFHFAVLAWQLERPVEGVSEFISAVQRNPAYLADLSFYTEIACAHQGRIQAGTADNLNLYVAETTLTQCLTALFDQPGLSPQVRARHREAYGWACLALARVAYGMACDMVFARRWLWYSLNKWPPVLWRSDWASWLIRSLIGRKTVQAVKSARTYAD